ncbi:hypothetical protein IAR55_000295 [Kwoniella newhampshirensis]|uniref:Uncharacterized protein n=1 Tax=Kwoniella newhampshirensis TaxID=1651941 RepID=A0AAW0Z685_9TREE
MSLQRRIPPPPLAIAIHPAHPRIKHTDHEKEQKKEVKDEKDRRSIVVAEAKKDVKDEKEKEEKDKAGAVVIPNVKGNEALGPDSPASMFPEPPTSAPGAAGLVADKADEGAKDGHVQNGDKIKDGVVEEVDEATVPAPNRAKGEEDKGKKEELDTAGLAKDLNSVEKKDEKGTKGPDPSPTPPSSLILLPPVPNRPLRTQLDIHPSAPYPPIHTDPRGAYYKYADAVGKQDIYIDVTKDGWLVEQWRERSEREALKRLTGEWERELEREIEKERKRQIKRKVPKGSEEILLQLWNDLAEVPEWHEISVDDFWDRYDWTDPEATIHLRRGLQRSESKPNSDIKAETLASGSKDEEADGTLKSEVESTAARVAIAQCAKEITNKVNEDHTGNEVELPEWTKEGLEEILATVGIQCSYKMKAPMRHWTDFPTGYLILTHGFFLLRLDIHIDWTFQKESNKFEALSTTADDRVFGAMVRAQMAEERKKKEKAYMERKERERKERKEKEKAVGNEDDSKNDVKRDDVEEKADPKDENVKKNDQRDQNGKEAKTQHFAHIPAQEENQQATHREVPSTPRSDVKVLNGDPIVPHHTGADADAPANDNKEKMGVVVVPAKESQGKKDLDAQHDQEAVLVSGPGPATGKDGKGVREGDKAIDGDADGQVAKPGMEDIAKAFQALDKAVNDTAAAAAGPDKEVKEAEAEKESRKGKDETKQKENGNDEADDKNGGEDKEKAKLREREKEKQRQREKEKERERRHREMENEPAVWIWSAKCEKWRWRNYESGLHDIRPGGWEERDWKVFADGREVWDYDADEEEAEKEEVDVHDWSL